MTLTANRKLKKELNKDVERLDDKKQSKLRIILDNITVEPMLGGYIISSVLTSKLSNALLLSSQGFIEPGLLSSTLKKPSPNGVIRWASVLEDSWESKGLSIVVRGLYPDG